MAAQVSAFMFLYLLYVLPYCSQHVLWSSPQVHPPPILPCLPAWVLPYLSSYNITGMVPSVLTLESVVNWGEPFLFIVGCSN